MDVPSYDYIIIDEVESVINHMMAQTVLEPYHKMTKICLMMQGKKNTRRVCRDCSFYFIIGRIVWDKDLFLSERYEITTKITSK